MKITDSTLLKVDNLFAKSRVDSEKALLTSRGGVYGSRSLAGRFLRFTGLAKPIELKEFKAFLDSRISPGMQQPVNVRTTAREDQGHLTAGAFKVTVGPRNVSARESFARALDGLKTDTNRAEEALARYASSGGQNVGGAQREILAELVAKLDGHIDQFVSSRSAVLGNADKHIRAPQDFIDQVKSASAIRVAIGKAIGVVGGDDYHTQLVKAGFSSL